MVSTYLWFVHFLSSTQNRFLWNAVIAFKSNTVITRTILSERTMDKLPPPPTYSTPLHLAAFWILSNYSNLKIAPPNSYCHIGPFDSQPMNLDTFNLLRYCNIQDEWGRTVKGVSETDCNQCRYRCDDAANNIKAHRHRLYHNVRQSLLLSCTLDMQINNM